jgi:superfamily II DNA helicase RecQ
VAGCNLVIRFNKPQNFSSYMQSKGRARAGQGNASFVLLGDESNFEEFSKTKEEYRNYEDMEKVRILDLFCFLLYLFGRC